MTPPFENFGLDVKKILNLSHFLTPYGGVGDNRFVEKSAAHTHAVFEEMDNFFAESAYHVASSLDNSLHDFVNPVDSFHERVVERVAKYCELSGIIPESRFVSSGETAYMAGMNLDFKPHEVFSHLTPRL